MRDHFATLLLVAFCLAGTAAPRAQADVLLPWRDADAVVRGRALYDAQCAACHGADLQGAPDWRSPGPDGLMPAPPHDATGHTWHHPDTMLFQVTKHGTAAVVGGGYRSAMPGFAGTLSDDEILAVLAYIKSTWPPRVIDTHDRINAGG